MKLKILLYCLMVICLAVGVLGAYPTTTIETPATSGGAIIGAVIGFIF